jgi:ADP-ribose pyrophosphatase YjhB (NUDIX family)
VFARTNASAIDAHWSARAVDNPSLFNGRVYLLESGRLEDGRFEGVLKPIEFKAFLYWKEREESADHGLDCFGSALIRSREGHVLLGRAGGHTLNAGRIYPPGGFFDERDVAGGQIDLEASVRRELIEETGLAPSTLNAEPGFWKAAVGPQISLAVEYRLPLAATELRSIIVANIARQAKPELDDVVVVRSRTDLANPAISLYTRVLLEVVLEQ